MNGRQIPRPLTDAPGDPDAGRALYHDAAPAGCAACHGRLEPANADADTARPEIGTDPSDPEAKRPDETGTDPRNNSAPAAPGAPALTGLAQRMDAATLRLWLVAPQVLRPGTAMPAFYLLGQRKDPNDPRYGEPTLSAAEIEDLIAYLLRPDRP